MLKDFGAEPSQWTPRSSGRDTPTLERTTMEAPVDSGTKRWTRALRAMETSICCPGPLVVSLCRGFSGCVCLFRLKRPTLEGRHPVPRPKKREALQALDKLIGMSALQAHRDEQALRQVSPVVARIHSTMTCPRSWYFLLDVGGVVARLRILLLCAPCL